MNVEQVKNRFGIIGNTPSINYALEVAIQVAPTDLTVLIQGESGVGKEVFSQVIHSLSQRKHNDFIAINCGAIPEGTIDSELFGHEKGSFTSAVDSRKGYFETVNGGTLFLDEIGEMPMGTQARLLRVLETGEFIKVGSSKVNKTDVRVIAATNKDLKGLIKENKFREDLYYRLSTVPIRVAPLRERRDDIIPLFTKFSMDFSERYHTKPITLAEDARSLLIDYYWPGNIRELKNVAEQISVLTDHQVVNADDISRYLKFNDMNALPSAPVTGNENFNSTSERDILYKLFFDLKNDFTDMKQIFGQILQLNGISPENIQTISENNGSSSTFIEPPSPVLLSESVGSNIERSTSGESAVMYNPNVNEYNTHDEVDENLNLNDMERDLIIKALQKHNNKRKLAASDLGISERTLYRKIKEYNIDE